MDTICVLPQRQLCADYDIVVWRVIVQARKLHDTEKISRETPPSSRNGQKRIYNSRGKILRSSWTPHRHKSRVFSTHIFAGSVIKRLCKLSAHLAPANLWRTQRLSGKLSYNASFRQKQKYLHDNLRHQATLTFSFPTSMCICLFRSSTHVKR